MHYYIHILYAGIIQDPHRHFAPLVALFGILAHNTRHPAAFLSAYGT